VSRFSGVLPQLELEKALLREQKGYITKIGAYWCGRLWSVKQVDGEMKRVRISRKIDLVTTRGKKPPDDIKTKWKAILRKMEDSNPSIPEQHRVTISQFVERRFLPDI
jgi:hypothetical protein